jgi:hypothetical protein
MHTARILRKASLLCALGSSACGGSSQPDFNPDNQATQSTATTANGSGSTSESSSAASNSSGGASSGSSNGATSGGSPAVVLDTGDGCEPGAMTETGQLSGRYGSRTVTVNNQEYFLQVNQWNMDSNGTQIVDYGGDYYFKVSLQQAEVPTNGGPTGFPSMFIGANAGNSTSGSGLPLQVSAITSLPTSWAWGDAGTRGDTASNSYNAAYDVWFSTNPQGEPDAYGPSGGYLMVWLYDPPDAQPIGGRAQFSDVVVDGAPGTWDIWIGPNGGRPVINYVATEPVAALSTDLNRFIRDAVENRPDTIVDEWYLTNVFVGFEIWRGGTGLETTRFCVEVNP